MTKTVVILGGSYAGLHVAHYLLKKQKTLDVKVILVSKSSQFYWNMASVRAIVPNTIKDDQLFQPLAAALERYDKDTYEILIGSAHKVDTAAKTVLVSPTTSTGSSSSPAEDRTLTYDQLIIATGARSSSGTSSSNSTTLEVPWKVLDTYDETVASLDKTRERVQAASTIIVGGAGATGVEVAGELGYEYGKTKEITLLCGGPSVLDGDSIGGAARAALEKLHVKIRLDARVKGSKNLAGGEGKTEVSLENGETLTADLYLPTVGMVPNSEMLDGAYLGEKGYVVTNDLHQVKGLESEGVWALGDVVSKPRGGFLITQKQAAGVAKNVELTLQGKAPSTVKLLPVDIMACSVGRSGGVGRMGPVKMFSTMVWLAKGRTLGIQRMPGYIDGSVA
ncbi:FAD/NAD(P)-binding domain-containing protein [Cryphonectria parasitica EP155]|uniref:FAD/NAD(P)-binding domain-containing protein n=1 Tax=Cryphonectria parasitica (strain ATCC 38755 / EP155) TaxID=660469 RepID=A0A9P5CQT2_CRYP1|nr:FAD/NAD(P)-binding domain-containing protein [Cryphonectria parasitica EP155]KAF3766787.1 FAD/NAD(P)-binding domain-containing protein [Cryphonectria parasitica EP155]